MEVVHGGCRTEQQYYDSFNPRASVALNGRLQESHIRCSDHRRRLKGAAIDEAMGDSLMASHNHRLT
jgi:hypothetical protein